MTVNATSPRPAPSRYQPVPTAPPPPPASPAATPQVGAPPPGSATLAAQHLAASAGTRAANYGLPPTHAGRQAQMNKVFHRVQGPFQALGFQVSARPAFRMNHGDSAKAVFAKLKKNTSPAHHRKLGTAMSRVSIGKASIDEYRSVVDAMLKSGALQAYQPTTAKDAAAHLQAMIDATGAGFDCSGYAHAALEASLPPGPKTRQLLGPSYQSKLQGARRQIPLKDLTAMDVLRLGKDAEGFEHKVMVYDNSTVSPSTFTDPTAKAWAAKGGAGATIRRIVVDGSFGGAGLDRRALFYNEANGTWAQAVNTPNGREFRETDGPANHREIVGVFRAPHQKPAKAAPKGGTP